MEDHQQELLFFDATVQQISNPTVGRGHLGLVLL